MVHEVLHLFQIWQDTPRRKHSQSFAIRYHKVCVQKAVPLGRYTWRQNSEQVTLLVAQSILKLFTMPVAFLERSEVPLVP